MANQPDNFVAPLATPQLPDPEPVSDTQPSLLPAYATIIGGLVFGLLLTGAISNVMGIKNPLTGVYNQIASYNAYNVARQDCLAAGGELGGAAGPGLNQIYLPDLKSWCTGISEQNWWKLSKLHNTISTGDDYGRRIPQSRKGL
jgi:hypothetical protein